MIQLVALGAIGGVAYIAWSSFKKHMAQIEAEEIEQRRQPKLAGELERDPVTGKYRLKGESQDG
ncbi:MAG: hypothetical protein OXR62_06640 [Ahrensia sp.]|nr:hypothetical protein [Ahrensia sp.]